MEEPDPQTESTEIRSEADDIQDVMRVLSEAGLFKGDQERRDLALKSLNASRSALAQDDNVGARAAMLMAATTIDDAVHSKSWLWRIIFIHRIGLFLYLTTFLILLLNVGAGYFCNIADDFWGVPISALGFGAIGAILRSLYWLHRQVGRRIFRFQFALAHLASPFIGGLLGAFAWLLSHARLLTPTTPSGETLTVTTAGLALTFLAGFSWEWLLGWVQQFVRRSSST